MRNATLTDDDLTDLRMLNSLSEDQRRTMRKLLSFLASSRRAQETAAGRGTVGGPQRRVPETLG